jgi:predicted transcriptional regulator
MSGGTDDLFDYYPEQPGFVAGSDTSEDAADSLDDRTLGRLRRLVLGHVSGNPNGATCDEIEVALELRHQTASARLRELQLRGWVETSNEKRLTRSGRMAHVYRRLPADA